MIEKKITIKNLLLILAGGNTISTGRKVICLPNGDIVSITRVLYVGSKSIFNRVYLLNAIMVQIIFRLFIGVVICRKFRANL